MLLHQALATLLESREFEVITVQDITEAATLNRATFYDHFSDKYALLECMVATKFLELLNKRGVIFDGSCSSALGAIALGVCDYLTGVSGLDCPSEREQARHLESAVIAVVREMILNGLKQHATDRATSPEIIAATVSSAIYGGAKEWMRTAGRCSSEEAADMLIKLVGPILHAA